MKVTKIVLTGVIAAAMMSTSCSSDSNDSMSDSDSMDMNQEQEHDHDSHSEHLDGDATNNDLSSSNSESTANDTHADGVHESSAIVEHEEVKLTLLPPAITETLKKKEYLDYKVEKAFLIEEDGVKTYEVVVKKDEVQSKMLFNDKGIRLDK